MELRPGYKQTELGVIPKEWEVRALREGVKLLSGHHVLAEYCNTKAEGTAYITGPADFPNGVIRHSKFTKRPTTICRGGDILVTVKGSGAGTMVLSDAAYCISRQLMAVRVTEWDTSFVFSSLQRDSSLFGAAATGLIPGLSRGHILDKEIAMPPGAEQRAIAAVLSDVDALLTKLDQLIAKKRDLKQAAMQQLLTGQTRLPGFSGEWELKRLGDLARIISGGTPKTSVPAYWNGSIRWCTPTDITSCTHKYLLETERSITQDGLANCSAQRLPVGALLLCSRATIGELKIAGAVVCTNQGFKSLVCNRDVSNEFLYYKLLTMKPQMVERAIGSTFLEISKKDTATLEITVPSTDEQAAIATVLSDMDAEIGALEARRDKTRALKQGMMQELLTGRIRLV